MNLDSQPVIRRSVSGNAVLTFHIHTDTIKLKRTVFLDKSCSHLFKHLKKEKKVHFGMDFAGVCQVRF